MSSGERQSGRRQAYRQLHTGLLHGTDADAEGEEKRTLKLGHPYYGRFTDDTKIRVTYQPDPKPTLWERFKRWVEGH